MFVPFVPTIARYSAERWIGLVGGIPYARTGHFDAVSGRDSGQGSWAWLCDTMPLDEATANPSASRPATRWQTQGISMVVMPF